MAFKIDKYALLKGISLGIEIAAPVIVLALLGRYIDRRYHLQDWAMISGVIIGAIVGFWNVVKFALKVNK